MHVKLFTSDLVLSNVTVFPRVNSVDSGDEAENINRDQPILDILCHLISLEFISKVIEKH